MHDADPVLVVDDNPMNLELTSTMLEACGFAHKLVQDGVSAIQAYEENTYCAVLMDCQMAGMDGFETTAMIRKIETENPARGRTPIVALTANAIFGDRENCLQAGMDDYLSKPIKRQQIYDMLVKWVPALGVADGQCAKADGIDREGRADVATPPADDDSIEYMRELAGSLGQDEAFIARLAYLFICDSEPLNDTITRAISERNGDSLFQAAHALKTCANNVGAEQLAKLCVSLEQAGKHKEFDIASDLFAEYELHYASAISTLRRYLAKQ